MPQLYIVYSIFWATLFFFYLLPYSFTAMEDFKKKNDYSVTVFLNKEKRLFTEYVHSIYAYSQWLDKQTIDWDYLLVYVRRTRAILCYYKKGDFLDSYPTYQSRGRVKAGW